MSSTSSTSGLNSSEICIYRAPRVVGSRNRIDRSFEKEHKQRHAFHSL